MVKVFVKILSLKLRIYNLYILKALSNLINEVDNPPCATAKAKAHAVAKATADKEKTLPETGGF